MLKLVHSSSMPIPSAEEPWAQIDWIFDMRAALAKSKEAKDNFKGCKKYMRLFLGSSISPNAASNGYFVDDEFDEYTLLRFKQFIDDQRISSSHAVTLLSAVRQTFISAIANKWIKLRSFIDFSLPACSRETDARKPYTETQMTAIMSGLNEDIRFARGLLKPYVNTGVGRERGPATNSAVSTSLERGWWTNENNLRWYFESRLGAVPITGTDPDIRKLHGTFLRSATNLFGGLHEMYRRWGVSAWIGPEIILPYVYKLVALTGLNPTVVLVLNLGDYFESHPLTGRPYIRYWKERGSGESDLHTDLVGGGALVLDDRQNGEVKSIWEEVIALTASFRKSLPVESQERLFVYETRSVKYPGKARDFLMDASSTGLWAKKFVARYKLTDTSGKPLTFTMARFRPSLVSRLLKQGVDIYVIQSILGHASILTTLRYIDSYDFMPHARREILQALDRIRENFKQYNSDQKPIADGDIDQPENYVFTTGIALCKNVFRPPENIRKAAGIKTGSPCTIFNMCLRCANVLILEEHLPQLFAMRREYLVAMEQGVSGTPQRIAIQQNIHILNNMLDTATSDWSADVLRDAEKLSEFVATAVDPIALRGVTG